MTSQPLPARANLFHYLFQQASLGIAVEDIEGKLLLANPALCSMLGYTEHELCGMNCSQFSDPQDSKDDWAQFQQLRAGTIANYSLEKHYLRKDGTHLWGRLNVSRLRNGGGESSPLVFAFLEDITQRKLAEQDLSRSNERLRLAIGASKSVGWEWDLRSGRDSWFGDLQTMFGIQSDTFVGRPEDFYRFVHQEDRRLVAKAVADAKENRKPYAAEFRVVRLDGTVRWVSAKGEFYYGSNGDAERMLGIAVDITEGKRAEETLREYEKAVEGSEEMISVLDREYRYLIANRKLLRLLNRKKEQVVGHLVPDVLNKGVFEGGIKEKLDQCFAGKTVTYELKYKYPELGERELFISYFPIEGAGSVDRIACVEQDITERKLTEESLRKSERRLRLAVQAGRMYAFDWDVVSDVITRSKESVGILNWPDPEHDTGREFHARVHPDDRVLYEASEAMLTPESPTYQIGFRTLRHDGTVTWLEDTGRASFDEQGKMVKVTGMVADITERKRAEEALRESEDQLRLLLDSTAEAIYGIDLQQRCTFCNPACVRILGYRHIDEVLGKNMHHLTHHTRADGTPFPLEECRIHRVTQTGDGVHADDEVLWRANGTGFPVEYWSYPQRKGQQVVGAVVAFIDITERTQAQAALANISRRLIEAQEQERIRIGRELHDDIVQRLSLAAIELQQLHKDPLILPEVRNDLGKLYKKISEIAADAQSLSHELHSARLQYLGIAAAVRSFCREFGGQQKVDVDFETHGLPAPLSPEISLCLFRVLQEALHNSAKHSGGGRFEVRLWGTSDAIHLTVRDFGAGFDPEAVKMHNGLGLISMEERLKLVNGTLSIDSRLGSGTTIEAQIPVPARSDCMRAAG